MIIVADKVGGIAIFSAEHKCNVIRVRGVTGEVKEVNRSMLP